VYVGNSVEAGELAHTRCPECHDVLIQRAEYVTIGNVLTDGRCPRCSYAIPGIWGARQAAPAISTAQ
jgi:pyruvate formate lyase activating enzyme